jgi:hypothetical protein
MKNKNAITSKPNTMYITNWEPKDYFMGTLHDDGND